MEYNYECSSTISKPLQNATRQTIHMAAMRVWAGDRWGGASKLAFERQRFQSGSHDWVCEKEPSSYADLLLVLDVWRST